MRSPRSAGSAPGRTAGRARTLRSRILLTTLVICTTGLVGFGIPLGVALSRVEHDRVVLRLEREASQLLAQVPDERLLTGGSLQLPAPIQGVQHTDDAATRIGVYSGSGQRLSGSGPAHSGLAAAAAGTGHEQVGSEAGQMAVALSVAGDRPGSATVRVAIGSADLAEDARITWWLMSALAAGILLVAGGAAFVLARRLTRPLEALSRNAQQLGDGDFTVRTRRTGVREIDAAGASLDATAARLGSLLERERAFSSNASHQIRTPLAALRLNLETLPLPADSEASAAVAESIQQLNRLEATVRELLALARDVEQPQAALDLPVLLQALARRWEDPVRRAGRTLTVGGSTPSALRGSSASLSHVLDVLMDNALQHGAGAITVTVTATGPAIAIDVRDEGAGVSGDPAAVFQRRARAARGHGIGLALARSLVEAGGGRLQLAVAAPHPVFRILLPVSPPLPAQQAQVPPQPVQAGS